MIGSLVVLLPSHSKRGALVIEHHDEKVTYRGSPKQLVLVAFYADCRHEVRPVTSGYPIAGSMAILRTGAREGGALLGLAPLRDDCARTLTKLVSAPPRAPGDWSITTRLGCKCELCTRLDEFLRSSREQQLEWPLAKDRRAHVHGTITSHELPLTHVTRRIGRPHTLVLTKTGALFTRAAAERATWTRDLAWLHAAMKRPIADDRGRSKVGRPS